MGLFSGKKKQQKLDTKNIKKMSKQMDKRLGEIGEVSLDTKHLMMEMRRERINKTLSALPKSTQIRVLRAMKAQKLNKSPSFIEKLIKGKEKV